MKKFMRGLYVVVCNIIGLPILLVAAVIGYIYMIIVEIIRGDQVNVLDDAKLYFGGIWSGMQQGYRILKYWIKNGNNQFDIETLMKGL